MNRSLNRSISILIVMLVLAGGIAAVSKDPASSTPAQLDGWTIESYQSLQNDNFPIQRVVPAPDGRQIGYEKDDELFCSLNVVTSEERCVTIVPELSGLNSERWFAPLAWSPDSEQIALTGQPYRYFYDTDLTTINLSTGESHILAQDMFRDDFLSRDSAEAPIFIDVSPTWSPDGTTIAVERSMMTKENSFAGTAIILVDAETGHPRKLADIPGAGPDVRDMGSTMSMAWSPDGSTIAAGFRHVDYLPQVDGLWLFDVESGESSQLVTVAEAETALRTIFAEAEAFAVLPLSWSPDGSRLLFSVGYPGSIPPAIWCFWIDINSRQITALPLPAHPEDEPDRRIITPRAAVWSPDGSMLLVSSWEADPVPGEDQTLIDPAAEDAGVGIRLIDVASGESVLLGHLPPNSMGLYQGAWGPDNDVIIAGYYLKLAHP